MKEFPIGDLRFSPFQKIGSEWMLVSAGKPEACSTMTASWGGVGVLWGKNVSFAFIRPQRHTLKFIDGEAYYSLSFLGEGCREALNYCGSHSGGENQKIEEAGLHLAPFDKAPVFEEAELTLVCKKLYRQTMDPGCFLDSSIDGRWYPGKDYHEIFVGEIVSVLVKE